MKPITSQGENKMNKYRPSRYLNVIELDNTALLFNGVNGCLDEVSLKLAEGLRSQDTSALGFLSEADRNFLAKRGHITTLPPETERARFREFAAAIHNKRIKGISHGSLMLLMSYNCNLSCKYCYQHPHRPHKSKALMSPAFLEEIFEKHLSKILPGIETKNIDLSFYGGEPFLPANEPVIRKALGYAKRYGMSSHSITNATMVDSMIDIFGPGPGKVKRVQISLDGNRRQHNASRIPASGEPTFDKILDNISLLLKQGTEVSIRLNLDKSKLRTIPELITELKARNILGDKNASIYASPLHDNIAKVDATDFMDVGELSSQVFKLGIDMEHPVSLRANDMSYLFKLEKGIGLVNTSFCMQTLQNSFVIDPFGDLYGCFEEAGYTEFRVGHVSAGGVEFFPLRETYKARHIANMPECLDCSVALTCGGQCGVRCRAVTGDLFKPHCSDIKKVILEGLKLAYQKRQQHPEESAANMNHALIPSTHG